MQITFDNQEAEKLFYDAMCNGLSNINYWEFQLDYSDKEYEKAKKVLQKANEGICYEDIFMQMLRMGYKLKFVDIGMDGSYSTELTLNMIHENMKYTPQQNLLNIISENDDSIDADAILQSVLFKDIIFG